MRDERVAELMKEAMADKRPREGWEQRVLATANAPRGSWSWKRVLVPAVALLLVVGLGSYLYSRHRTERVQQAAVMAQKAHAAQFAEHEADQQQKELVALKKELEDLKVQLAQSTTEADRRVIRDRMKAVKAAHSHGSRRAAIIVADPKAKPAGDTSTVLDGLE
jgi:hypothetical protein